ncbi:SDR family NAD(P)-dependent oxidoreductase [Breznakiella homolactica]|uniref:Glucose 1-dehydrogenase n=1 Tax=Breznakiella homolactica TaxID=2798577 RepID=A0A7T7XNK9_9SPIR|nr:glucose 1-dehydrogenase [Breznakiella homolactica]QQO09640.1 glucose 1-dehydrogenase [Breznakiella homolactica]
MAEQNQKTALVTGGTGGLGKDICRQLLSDGFTVYCCDINDEAGAKTEADLAQYGTAVFLHLDVSEEKDWQEAIRRILADTGRLDVLVNNAGINIRVVIEECTVEQWDRMFQVNVRGPFLGIKHSLPVMRSQGGGSIVNISSICGLVGHLYTNESYTATKGAVTLLTKSVATRYAKDGIRCNSVHPSTVDTEIVKILFQDPKKKQERLDEVPMGRLGLPGDVASAVSYLASDKAAFINGVQLPVDGGLTAY